MNLSTIKLGIIGVGNMGKNHVRIARELKEEFSLDAVFDPDAARVEQLGLTDIACGSEAELMDKVEAVIVASPSSMHKRVGLLAAEKNVHLLMEKPLALSEADAREVVEAFEKNGKALMTDHVERYNPVVRELSKILEKEQIAGVEIERCSPMDRRISDTDVIYDLMIHDVDILMNAIMPGVDFRSCSAYGTKVYSENFMDYVQALFQFDNDVVASVISSRTTESKIRKVRVHCATCFVDADLLNRRLTVTRKTRYTLDVGYDPRYSQENIIEQVFVPNVEPLRMSQLQFAECIREGKESLTSGKSALKSLNALDTIKSLVY